MPSRVYAGLRVSASQQSGRKGSAGSTRLRGSPSGWPRWYWKRWSRALLVLAVLVRKSCALSLAVEAGVVAGPWCLTAAARDARPSSSAGAGARRALSPG